jgi:hypothetical protein
MVSARQARIGTGEAFLAPERAGQMPDAGDSLP